MVYDPRLYHRRSIRLRGHNYAGGGAYFITICTQAKRPLFGEIVEGEMMLNEVGRLVQKIWQAMPQRFGTLTLDGFQMMPNHLHAIFILPGPGLEPALAAATGALQTDVEAGLALRAPVGLVLPGDGKLSPYESASRAPTMGDVVGAFKSICTIAVNKLMSRTGTRLLQRNFYEHIIRDVAELEIIRYYILHNPQRWLEDPENPETT